MNARGFHKTFERVFVGMWISLFLYSCSESPQVGMASKHQQEKAPEPVQSSPAPVSVETLETYQWYCSQCHGLEGKGDGINAQWVTVPPRNHTKADYLETRSDQELFNTIKLGGLAVGRAPCMPAWGHTLDDKIIESLVRLIRELCHCEAI